MLYPFAIISKYTYSRPLHTHSIGKLFQAESAWKRAPFLFLRVVVVGTRRASRA